MSMNLAKVSLNTFPHIVFHIITKSNDKIRRSLINAMKKNDKVKADEVTLPYVWCFEMSDLKLFQIVINIIA
ncbi:hypothetical protein O9G_003577 [Rozella allomycis CSF55]|uniref:Uncharacterized protein n=1 Tax=Rozella allomycis (strain CSF55) TaxID=988480 RepID=A0A075B446_ROZAC|nr:hypothetical protein O9G_003577 [Rozella allomycis CSF55]|eukprot:EPZ35859.1 hypothetical protein O9G_003577 [Rozella allomycis CSF55]